MSRFWINLASVTVLLLVGDHLSFAEALRHRAAYRPALERVHQAGCRIAAVGLNSLVPALMNDARQMGFGQLAPPVEFDPYDRQRNILSARQVPHLRNGWSRQIRAKSETLLSGFDEGALKAGLSKKAPRDPLLFTGREVTKAELIRRILSLPSEREINRHHADKLGLKELKTYSDRRLEGVLSRERARQLKNDPFWGSQCGAIDSLISFRFSRRWTHLSATFADDQVALMLTQVPESNSVEPRYTATNPQREHGIYWDASSQILTVERYTPTRGMVIVFEPASIDKYEQEREARYADVEAPNAARIFSYHATFGPRDTSSHKLKIRDEQLQIDEGFGWNGYLPNPLDSLRLWPSTKR